MSKRDQRERQFLWFEYRGKAFKVRETAENDYKLSFRGLRLDYAAILLNDEANLLDESGWTTCDKCGLQEVLGPVGNTEHDPIKIDCMPDPVSADRALQRSKLKADWSEGILGRHHVNKCVMRDKTVEQVRGLVEEKGFVLLTAPPRSGKTALLQLLEMSYPEDHLLAVNMTERPRDMTWADFFEQRTTRSWRHVRNSGGGAASQYEVVTLLLIDELQSAYPSTADRDAGFEPMDDLWTFIKRMASADARARMSPLRIVAAAVYGHAPSNCVAGMTAMADMIMSLTCTPFEIGYDRKVQLHRNEADPGHPTMAYTDEEFDKLWTLTWADREPALFAGSETKENIRWVSAKQPGVVATILDQMEEMLKQQLRSRLQAPEQVPYLGDDAYWYFFRSRKVYDALRGTRSFLKLHELQQETAVQWRLLRPLVEAGCGVEGVPEGATADGLGEPERALLAECLRRGWLVNYNHPTAGTLYTCATPLHLYFLEHELLRSRVQFVQERPNSFALLLELIITRLSPRSLSQTLSVGTAAMSSGTGTAGGTSVVAKTILERKLQMDLHATALSLVPATWTVCPDVGKVYGASGLVDMWVASPDRAAQWAVEFIRNGNDLLEHERRFEPGGKYYNLPFTEFALVDFRTPQSASPRARPAKHATFFVLFEPGYVAATMIKASDKSVVWGPNSLLGDRSN